MTLATGIPANEEGQRYTVVLEAGPTVYENPEQATRADHSFVVELLRGDQTVLAKCIVTPGAWSGEETFTKRRFRYEGDGSGNVRIRISPMSAAGTVFTGAISHLEVHREK